MFVCAFGRQIESLTTQPVQPNTHMQGEPEEVPAWINGTTLGRDNSMMFAPRSFLSSTEVCLTARDPETIAAFSGTGEAAFPYITTADQFFSGLGGNEVRRISTAVSASVEVTYGWSTAAPSAAPTGVPSASPSAALSAAPTASPSAAPTAAPTAAPSAAPTAVPTAAPSAAPTASPSAAPSGAPTAAPSAAPTTAPSVAPSMFLTWSPTMSRPTPPR